MKKEEHCRIRSRADPADRMFQTSRMTLTIQSSSSLGIALTLLLLTFPSPLPRRAVEAVGSAGTAAAVSGTGTVCGIVAGERTQGIQCFLKNQTIRIRPSSASFESIAGGENFFCGILSGGFSLLCWDTLSGFEPRRLYYSEAARLTNLTVGDYQVCAVVFNTGIARLF